MCRLSALELDFFSGALMPVLSDLKPFIVVHTSGPFQGQDYRVPEACIGAGIHYIDLADDRRFVCDFAALDGRARNTGSIAVSGASSVPGLSSVVIDRYANEFSRIAEIDISITPGSNVDLGEATSGAILSGMGHPFKGWRGGAAVELYGWMDPRRRDFGRPLGFRWLANVDVPDLELFPERYPGVQTVGFQAGHELPAAHLAMVFMGLLARWHVVNRWDRYTRPIYRIGQKLKRLGSDLGGMCIKMTGMSRDGRPQSVTWKLIAPHGIGPRIPTFPAILLTRKILDGELTTPGAGPCLGRFDLESFSRLAGHYGIYQEVERTGG